MRLMSFRGLRMKRTTKVLGTEEKVKRAWDSLADATRGKIEEYKRAGGRAIIWARNKVLD